MDEAGGGETKSVIFASVQTDAQSLSFAFQSSPPDAGLPLGNR